MKKRSFLLLAMLTALPLLAMRPAPAQIARARAEAERAITANNFDQARKIIGDLRGIRQERLADQLELQLLRRELAQSQAQVQQLQQVRAPAPVDEALRKENAALRARLDAIKQPYEALKQSLTALQGDFAGVYHLSLQTHPVEAPSLEVLFGNRDFYLKQLENLRPEMDRLNIKMGQILKQADDINRRFFPRG